MKRTTTKKVSLILSLVLSLFFVAGAAVPAYAIGGSRMTASQIMDKMQKNMQELDSFTVDSECTYNNDGGSMTIETARTTEIDRDSKEVHSTATINGQTRDSYIVDQKIYTYSEILDMWIGASGDPVKIAEAQAAIKATLEAAPRLFVWTVDKNQTNNEYYVLVTEVNLDELQGTAAAQLEIPEETLEQLSTLTVDMTLFIAKDTYYLEKAVYSGSGTDVDGNQITIDGSASFRDFNSTTIDVPDLSGALVIPVDELVDKFVAFLEQLESGNVPEFE